MMVIVKKMMKMNDGFCEENLLKVPNCNYIAKPQNIGDTNLAASGSKIQCKYRCTLYNILRIHIFNKTPI